MTFKGEMTNKSRNEITQKLTAQNELILDLIAYRRNTATDF